MRKIVILLLITIFTLPANGLLPVDKKLVNFLTDKSTDLNDKEVENISLQWQFKKAAGEIVGKVGRSVTRYLTGDANNDLIGNITDLTAKEPSFVQGSNRYEELNDALVSNIMQPDDDAATDDTKRNITEMYMMALLQCNAIGSYVDNKSAPLEFASEEIYRNVFGQIMDNFDSMKGQLVNAFKGVSSAASSISGSLDSLKSLTKTGSGAASSMGGKSSGAGGSVLSTIGNIGNFIATAAEDEKEEDENSQTTRRYMQASNGKMLEQLKLNYMLNQNEACDLKIKSLSKMYTEAMGKR